MKSVIKKYFMNFVWIIVFALIALYFTLKGDFNIIIDTVQNAQMEWIAIAVGLMLAYIILEGYVLMAFGRLYNKAYSFKQGVVNSFCATFFNGVTPFQSGGQFAQVYVFNKQGIAPSYAASILLLNFIVYQTVMVLYTLGVVIFKYNYYRDNFSNFFSLALIGFAINFIVIVSLFVAAKSKRVQNFFVEVVLRIGAKVRIVKDYDTTVNKVERYLEDFRMELKTLQKNKKILITVSLINVVRLTILYLIPYFCARALSLDVSGIHLSEFIGITSFIYMITAFIPIPGASGGSEGTFVIMFSYLLGSIGAKSSVIVWRFVTYYFALLVGGLIFALNGEINRKEQ